MMDASMAMLHADGFMPHGYCILWTPSLLWLYIISDTLIAASYYSIPVALVYFVRKRPDLQFNWIVLMFSLFIFACGTTHLFSIWTFWHPDYWLDASIKAVTAAASLVTAVVLWPLIPRALKQPSLTQLSNVIVQLEHEIKIRKEAESQLAKLNETLEQRVEERTRDLSLQILERRAAEGQLRLLNDELDQRVGQRTAELQSAMQEMEAFSYSVSHDLRAPLRGIDGWSLALVEDYREQLDNTARHYLDIIRSESQRMGRLIDDMLKLSRVSRVEIHGQQVDLTGLAEAIANRLHESYPRLKLVFEIEPGLLAWGDRNLLEIAMTNLFENACKFSAKREEARIRFGKKTMSVNGDEKSQDIYYVQDNGVGFDEAYADKLFGAFQRLHNQDEYPGSGIGLATVRRIIHRLGGKVWANSIMDQGATFNFTLGEQHVSKSDITG